MHRRDFIKTSLLAGGALWLSPFESAFAEGKADKMAGKRWKGWKKGQLQVHFIYTGVAESMFFIFPDGWRCRCCQTPTGMPESGLRDMCRG